MSRVAKIGAAECTTREQFRGVVHVTHIGVSSNYNCRYRKAALQLDVQPESGNPYWSTVPVVARILNVLQIESSIHPAPEMGGVVALENIFAAIGKRSVAQKKAEAAEFQILRMLLGCAPSDSCYDGFRTGRV
jgi:hypothetical protein